MEFASQQTQGWLFVNGATAYPASFDRGKSASKFSGKPLLKAGRAAKGGISVTGSN
jgi:hypothetical protein